MQDSGIPAKFPIPFAASAGAGYTRVVPQASQIGVQNGAASLTDGFPPNCFIPIASGGSWPFGQDVNGILKQITQWSQWLQAGGAIPFDATFQSAIGGYPKNAIIGSGTTAGLFWLSTTDANTTNPDSGGAGWLRWPLTRNGEVTSADLATTGVTAGSYAGATVTVAADGRITSIAAVGYAPASEVTARSNADAALQAAINTEASNRATGDTNEANARYAQITALFSSLNNPPCSGSSPQRIAAVTYTNTVGRPMLVSVLAISTGPGSNMILLISGNSTWEFGQQGTGSVYTVSGIVPVGATYQVTFNVAGGTLLNWMEIY